MKLLTSTSADRLECLQLYFHFPMHIHGLIIQLITGTTLSFLLVERSRRSFFFLLLFDGMRYIMLTEKLDDEMLS
jgi:hypothetical protein